MKSPQDHLAGSSLGAVNIPPLMYRTRPQWGQSQRHLWGDNKLSNQLDENLQLLNQLFWKNKTRHRLCGNLYRWNWIKDH
jgi:hypothetical protein